MELILNEATKDLGIDSPDFYKKQKEIADELFAYFGSTDKPKVSGIIKIILDKGLSIKEVAYLSFKAGDAIHSRIKT